MLPSLATFVGISLVVICTPGPDTALTVRNAVVGGRRGGITTAAGVAGGQLVWTLATAVGLSALLQVSQLVFGWLRIVGAAYLIYLGVRSLVSAWRRQSEGRTGVARLTGVAAFRQGLVSNLANPKMVAFFVSVLPQFVPADVDPFAGFVAFGTAFCMLTFAWLTLYAVLLDRTRAVVRRASFRRVLDTVTGAVLVGFGIRLAASGVSSLRP